MPIRPLQGKRLFGQWLRHVGFVSVAELLQAEGCIPRFLLCCAGLDWAKWPAEELVWLLLSAE